MLVIVQARMSSQRLPGKVLRGLHGKPMLGWTIDRIRAATQVKRLIVATSDDDSDDSIEDYCTSRKVNFHRGSLHNVAARFAAVAKSEKAEAFMRISGDSPLIDPGIIDFAIKLYRESSCDLTTNIMLRTFPKGQSVEILTTETFARVCENMTEAHDQEHVTKPYYRTPENYRVVAFTSGENSGSIQLSADTDEDFQMVEQIIDASDGNPKGWRELVSLRNRLSL